MSSLIGWVTHSAADDFWIVAGILIGLTIAGFVGAFYFFMRKRIMEDTPTSKIRSAAQGYVELSGRGDLMEGPKIIAPLTSKYCTWYSYKVEERRHSGKNSRWATVQKGRSEELFLIIDETGQCVIDPEGASVTTIEKDVWYGSSSQPTRGPKATGGYFPLAAAIATLKNDCTRKRHSMRLACSTPSAVLEMFLIRAAMYATC